MTRVPVLAVTAGDPAGIGPEIILKVLTPPPRLGVALVIIGDLRVFAQTARRLRLRLPRWRVMARDTVWSPSLQQPTFLDCRTGVRARPGRSGAAAGRASLTYLDEGIALCRARQAHGLVTGPVTKWAVQRARPGFVGQTEYLARAFGARGVVMMFASQRLRVALVTRHLPLRQAARAATPRLWRDTLIGVERALRAQLGVRRPRLAVCGLNPHAGEGGRFGDEERRVIVPVLRRLRRAGLRCDGPFAADGFFAQARRYDAVVCGYHDQGLIPFKMLARDRGCQLSLGLPVVRTSPDHGSALDIAGRGRADPGAMRYALAFAARLLTASR
ncbi:MAG: 4-hydroxythreonine-4-phosphate dehydrogenase PdxA [Candidatus Omnitrophica bacterium]|nr:4-hydroxythreonine-4-phosphate dehydrogenase PdxA [Candidatus Omnitrophota bacterium]